MTNYDEALHLRLHIDVTIRKLQYDDLAKLEWYGQYAHFRHLFLRSYREQKLGKRLMLVADMNGFPIGRLFIQFVGENTALVEKARKGYLYSFHVMEMFQQQGIGTRLMDVAETLLRKRRYQTVTIAVAKENLPALHLYQKRHYEIFSESDGNWKYINHEGEIEQVNEPCWLLAKKL